MCDFIKNSKKLLMEVVCFSFPRQALHQLTTIPTQVSNILLVLFWRNYSPCISPPFIFFCAHLHTWRFSGPLLQRSTEYIDVCIYALLGTQVALAYKSDEEKTHEWLAALRDAFLQHKGYVEKLEIRIFHVSHLTWFLFCQSCASLQNFRFYFKALHYIK